MTSEMPSSFAPPSVLPDISPTRGEIGYHLGLGQSRAPKDERQASGRLISPRVGEMSGRTEGGNMERYLCSEGTQ
jgi:hypothetical protein